MIGGEDPFLGSVLGVAFVRGIQAGSAPHLEGADDTAYRMVGTA
jgi:beta-glucosidase-like glycosyl hydrolase